MKSPFTSLLLTWNKHQNTRKMPWKGEKDPYLIWLSEIILQQTRVEQGMPYFQRFKQKYPTVKHLALAKEDDVMKLWQGLGYYSRARNLHETAKNIHHNMGGKLPDTYDELVKLKGVGAYTASAIASFAFNELKAVVDGNVIRVLSRVLGIATPFDTTAGKKQFAEKAQQLIDSQQPAAYNQAIMDFGAVVCVPQNPTCETCPMNKICVAYLQNKVDELPRREKRTKILPRYFNYLIIKNKTELLIEKRSGNDIWKNLYQLPLIETAKPLNNNFHKTIAKHLGFNDFSIDSYSPEISQLLSHRKMHFRFIVLNITDINLLMTEGFQKVKLSKLNQYAFPKTINEYLINSGLLKEQ
jgi:A/G-specific adenine glycosylase